MVERYYSEDYGEWYDVRSFRVDYQTKGGGSWGNVDRVSIRTLATAKALAETHHAKRKALICQYGDERNIPEEAWYRYSNEMLEWQQRAAQEEAAA